MKIGTVLNEAPLPQLIEAARKIEAAGLSNIWMANIFGYDAISILAILGRETSHIGLGTAVTPTYPRHPTAIAQQAITTAAVTNNRFTLGIGLSHKLVIEDMFGMSYDKPAKHMREYLSVLMPLARGETANFEGQQYSVRGVNISVPGAERLPVVIAGLGRFGQITARILSNWLSKMQADAVIGNLDLFIAIAVNWQAACQQKAAAIF